MAGAFFGETELEPNPLPVAVEHELLLGHAPIRGLPLVAPLFKGVSRMGDSARAARKRLLFGGDYGFLPWFSVDVGPKGLR